MTQVEIFGDLRRKISVFSCTVHPQAFKPHSELIKTATLKQNGEYAIEKMTFTPNGRCLCLLFSIEEIFFICILRKKKDLRTMRAR